MLGKKSAVAFVGRFHAELVNRLKELEDNRDAPMIVATIAHKLVGIAGALGLDELAETCQALSISARAASCGAAIENDLARVNSAGRRAIEALSDYAG